LGDELLLKVRSGLSRESSAKIVSTYGDQFRDVANDVRGLLEIVGLQGDAWPNLLRHLRFGEAIDWCDIADSDWPLVVRDIELASDISDVPLPLPDGSWGDRDEIPLTDIALRISSDGLKRLLGEAEALIEGVGYASAVDRLHTALHEHLRLMCKIANIQYSNGDSVAALLKKLRSNLEHMASGSRSADIGKVLNSVGAILDSLGPIRNNASSAHPSEETLEVPEARLVVSIARSVLVYLDGRFNEPTSTSVK
jgi:hypothetical protein